MSHVRVWRDMVARGHQRALVFEDDIELGPDFRTKLDTILLEANLIQNWDMIFLGYITPIIRSRVTNSLYEGQPLGTHAYIVNLECARKLAVFDPKFMKVGIDFQLNRMPLRILCSSEILTSQGDVASRHGLFPLASALEGDIGWNRTLDFGFFARWLFQNAKTALIFWALYFVLKIVRSGRA